MKTIKYRKYEYTGEYKVKELEVSDNSTLYEIDFLTLSKFVKDKNTYTKSYLLISSEQFNGASPVGDLYAYIMDTVFIEDSNVPVMDIESAPKIKNAYYVVKRDDDTIVNKLNKFTITGAEVYSVDSSSIIKSEIKYGFIFLAKFTSDPEIIHQYCTKAEEIYKAAIID